MTGYKNTTPYPSKLFNSFFTHYIIYSITTMTQTLQNKLSNSKKARWTALILVSVTMMLGYFFTDVMSPLEPLLTEARGLTEAQGGTGFGLGWTSDEYGFFSGAYGYFNVFLLLLFLGGVILDKFGIRFTGIMSTILMFLGAILKWYAVSHNFEGTINVPFFGEYQTQVVLAATGFAIYGVGCEIAGVTVTKILVKWFTGHELALAMGLQVALARIGTACTLAYSLPFAMGKHIEYVDTLRGRLLCQHQCRHHQWFDVLKGFFRAFLWCSGISGLGRRHVVYRHDCLSCLLRYGQEGRCLRSSNPSRK